MSPLASARLPPAIQSWIRGRDAELICNAYVQRLQERGYAQSTINNYLGGVAHFFHWLTREAVRIEEVDEKLIGLFLERHLPNCHCAPFCRRARRSMLAALAKLLELLRVSGRVRPRASTGSAAINRELQDFEHYLKEICGLAPATRVCGVYGLFCSSCSARGRCGGARSSASTSCVSWPGTRRVGRHRPSRHLAAHCAPICASKLCQEYP